MRVRRLKLWHRNCAGRFLRDLRLRPLVVAYEPVWAIGTGRTPTLADIAEIHDAIRDVLTAITTQGDGVHTLRWIGETHQCGGNSDNRKRKRRSGWRCKPEADDFPAIAQSALTPIAASQTPSQTDDLAVHRREFRADIR